MAERGNGTGAPSSTGATAGYEVQLWQMADALRGSMDAAEYKHGVLGLIFHKYISDAFEEQHARLEAERVHGADPEDPDEYRALSIFWVPPEARWQHVKAQAKQPSIGQLVDAAMEGIERDNPALKGWPCSAGASCSASIQKRLSAVLDSLQAKMRRRASAGTR